MVERELQGNLQLRARIFSEGACLTGRKAKKGGATRRSRKAGSPKFKTKNKTTPRFAYTTGGFSLIDGNPKALHLPKIGHVHCMKDATKRASDGRALHMTISQRARRWYASLTVERDDASVTRKTPRGGAVGADLGVKNLATLSARIWTLRISLHCRTALPLRTRATRKR